MKKYTTAQRLKEIMNAKNIKQIDILNKVQPICEKWGVKMGSNDLSQYVTGKVEPSQKKLSVLAEALDTNEVWLMGYDVPMTKELSANDFLCSTEQYSPEIINCEVFANYNSLTQLSVKTGIPSTEIRKIIDGENKIPKPMHLKKIADALEQDVTEYFNGYGYIESSELENDLYNSGIRFLLNEQDRNDLCSILREVWQEEDENITVKKIYSSLFDSEKEDFSYNDLKSILKSDNALQFDNAEIINFSPDTIQIPVLGTIKAGIAIEAQQDILEYIDIPKEWTMGGKNYYGLKISGDSMYPKYNENDIVIFEQVVDYTIANNKDCAVMINGYDATFKNVTISEAGITLVPLNLNNQDNYLPTFYNNEQIENLPVRIIGIAKEKRTRL